MRANLGLSEDVWSQLPPPVQDGARLLGGDADLQGGGHRRADEAGDYGADLVLDGGLVTVRVTQVLSTPEGEEGERS